MIHGIIVMEAIKLEIKHVSLVILDHYVYNVIYTIKEGLEILEQKINNALSAMKDTKTISIYFYL